MRVAFIVTLRQAAAQAAQTDVALSETARFLKRGSIILDGETMIAHQQIKIEPVARLGAYGGNKSLGLEQFGEGSHAHAGIVSFWKLFPLRFIRREKRHLDLVIDEKILLVIVPLHSALGKFLHGGFVVVALKIESFTARLTAKGIQSLTGQARFWKDKIQIFTQAMSQREGKRRAADQNKAGESGLFFQVIPHPFSFGRQQEQILSQCC